MDVHEAYTDDFCAVRRISELPMHLTFLGSRLPLTKTFLSSHGVLTATPYPHVSKVTSYHEQAVTLQDFHAAMLKHAAVDHCLFGGQLTAPLTDASRAGKTLKAPKEWLVFDFDKVQAKDAADAVARYLPPECQNVSYIAQLSASMFRPDNTSWSGHIFMLLKETIDAQRLKQWFEWLNFNVPSLETSLSLSDSLQALHWSLDRTVAFESKLIYIASPKCHGFEPAIKQHITLVKKRLSHLTIPAFTPIDSITIRQKINDLRTRIGEAAIDYDTVLFEGHEMLRKTDECSIHGIKTSGDHYIRFNLNGGDSCAYFIDLRNPDVIRNFKGEPFLSTKDAAPDLYKALRKVAPAAVSKQPLEDGCDVLAFYTTNQSSQIRIGVYNPTARRLDLNNSNESAARAWLAEYGLVQKGYFPHMTMHYDPTSDVQYMPGCTHINSFRATDYMAKPRTNDAPSTIADLPPCIGKTIRSMLGTPDDKLLTHFLNWLAYIFQTRKKAGTAWVLNGRTGTGKGMFVKTILTPIFGAENVKTIQFGLMNGEFNAFLEDALFVVFEEADTKAVENSSALMAKLKHYITDSPITIRKMRTDPFDAANFTNFFLNTNERTPAVITADDRRFNFGERQENAIVYTPNELVVLLGGSELDVFADVLQRWPVAVSEVTRIIDTDAKRDAHEASTPINQLIAEAISKGNLQFFLDRVPSDSEAAADFFNRFNTLGLFKAQLETYTAAAATGETCILTDESLFTLFRTLVPDVRYFQDSKTWRKRHYKSLGLDVDKQHRLPGSWDKRIKGVKVEWQLPEGVLAPDVTGKVTQIKKEKRT